MSRIEPETRVIVPAGVHTRRLDGELVVLDLERGEYYGLNAVGADAFERLAAGKSVLEIAAELVDVYEIDRQTLLADLLVLARELEGRRLILPSEP
jgi:hypothetical protein